MSTRRYRFGDHVLDTATRQLTRGGQPVHLSPKGFQLLELLLQRRPDVLSKSELQDRLWPDTHVLEANLANLVAEVRAALGDDPRRPRYIRTAHRYGYAFLDESVGASRDAPAGRPGWTLVWSGGEARLDEGEHVLGRDGDVCLDFATVSRRHARVRIEGDRATLEDLASKNGTWLNARRVEGAADLSDGDEIRLGSLRLKLRRGGHHSTVTAAPTR